MSCIQATIVLGCVRRTLAALSVLCQPTPDWGVELNLAHEHLEALPYLAIFPGLAFACAMPGLHVSGYGLRDILDLRVADR